MVTEVPIGREVDGETAWLEPGAAASYNRMLAAGLPRGGITDAGRTYDEQAAIFTSRYEPRATGTGPFGQVAWWRGVRYVRTSGPSSAAPPGESTHESGRALDLQPAQEAWVRAHPDHGWRFPISSERWHAEYGGIALDRHLTPTSPPAPLEEDDMSAAGEAAILAALSNIEGILAGENGNGIRPRLVAAQAAIDATRADVGTVANELRALAARPAGEGGSVDLAPVLAAIQALPAATVAAIKAAL